MKLIITRYVRSLDCTLPDASKGTRSDSLPRSPLDSRPSEADAWYPIVREMAARPGAVAILLLLTGAAAAGMQRSCAGDSSDTDCWV